MAIELKGSPAALTIIIVMLMGIVGFFVIVPEPYREGMLEEPLANIKYENKILDVNPGKIEPTEEATSLDETDLPVIIVDNTPQIEEQRLADQIFIEKSLVSAEYQDIDFSVDTTTFSDARLHFVVSEKVGDGQIRVKLNQHSIFSRTAGRGETLDIHLPKHYLFEGVNTLRISVVSSEFWKTNSYLLTKNRLDIDKYPERVITQSFSVTQNAAKSLEKAELTAYIKPQGDKVNLRLALNDEELFNAIPSSSFKVSLPMDVLKRGSNTLSWMTDKGGKYTVQYGLIKVEELEIEEGARKYYFSASAKDMHFANQKNKYTCELYLLKESGANEISIKVNSEAHTYKFSSGKIIADVCSLLKEGTNSILLTAEEDISVKDMTLTIKNKEEKK